MTQQSLPWTGTTPGDAGAYSSLTWELLQQYLPGVGGARANVGPFLGSGTQPNDGLIVTQHAPVNTQITIGIGAAMVQGIFYLNDAAVSFTIGGNASGNPRIDTAILRADYVAQTVRLVVLAGSPAVTPTPPALTQTAGVTWEIPLADIAVASGFVSITNANITPRHEWVNAASGVYLDNILNNSGGTLQDGDVVIWDTSVDRGVTTTTTQDDRRVVGIWRGRTDNGGYGRIQRSGVGTVNANGAVTRGNLLTSFTTAKQAVKLTTGIKNSLIGRALETTAGTGLVLTHIQIQTIAALPYVRVLDSKANTTAPASITSGAWRTRELTTEETDTDSLASLAANQITLQPGRWMVWAAAQPAAAAGENRIRLQNITAGATLLQGNNASASAATAPAITALFGLFDIAVATVIELQHFATATGNGGRAVSSGEAEIYAQVDLIRMGEYAL